MVLPPDALEIFKQDDVIPLILQQNGLSGAHSVPRFKTKPKDVTLVTMGVAPEMIPPIQGKGSCGACPVKINLKKEEDTKKAKKAKETVAGTADEKKEEEETPKAAATQDVPEKMDTTVREEKDSTKNPNDEES